MKSNFKKILSPLRPVPQKYKVAQRLDESLPLQTAEWKTVEQALMRLTEFAPESLVSDVMGALAFYADDQARRGYILGQEDLIKEMTRRAA